MRDEDTVVYKQLRRLQEHSRSNIPAMMAHRSMSSFTLQEEPLPVEASDHVLVVVYPQDPFIGEPEVRTMSVLDIRNGLTNSRVRVQDSEDHPIAEPDADGNYLYWCDTPQFNQVNSFYYTTFTLRMFERYARRALPWSFPSPRIILDAHIGKQANAFYNEQDRLLGFQTFEFDGESFSTAHSADIISHETAHAVLDGIRDLYNESFGLGPTAFHECFGDIAAMLVALHDDSLIRRLLEWTQGDLRRDNFVAMVAEQLTDVLKRVDENQLRSQTVYLRNAINNLAYQPFTEIPYIPDEPEFKLGRQSHNYSRLFTGAFYDILVGIYEKLKETSPAHIAIYRARDMMGYLLMTAIELGPVGEFDFSDMAKAFLIANEVLYNGQYHDVLKKVFEARKLLTAKEADTFIESIRNLPDIRLPKAINSALAAALFLEERVLPSLGMIDVDLIPMATYRNATGYAYLTYFTSQRVILEGDQYKDFDGANVDIFGGLTLMFDSSNQLRSVFYRPVTDEDVNQIKLLILDLIDKNLIVDNLITSMSNLRYRMPQGLYVPDEIQPKQGGIIKDENAMLVKYPITSDPIPTKIPHFADYLQQLKVKKDKS